MSDVQRLSEIREVVARWQADLNDGHATDVPKSTVAMFNDLFTAYDVIARQLETSRQQNVAKTFLADRFLEKTERVAQLERGIAAAMAALATAQGERR
jgi:hypothetical protein